MDSNFYASRHSVFFSNSIQHNIHRALKKIIFITVCQNIIIWMMFIRTKYNLNDVSLCGEIRVFYRKQLVFKISKVLTMKIFQRQ